MTNTDRSSTKTTVYWTSGTNVLAGIWLVIAPFALAYNDIEGALWNDIIIGVSVFVLALVRVGNPLQYEGVSWTNFVLGIWLLAAPFVIGYSDTGPAVANDIILGVVVLILAAWSAYASRDVRPAA